MPPEIVRNQGHYRIKTSSGFEVVRCETPIQLRPRRMEECRWFERCTQSESFGRDVNKCEFWRRKPVSRQMQDSLFC